MPSQSRPGSTATQEHEMVALAVSKEEMEMWMATVIASWSHLCHSLSAPSTFVKIISKKLNFGKNTLPSPREPRVKLKVMIRFVHTELTPAIWWKWYWFNSSFCLSCGLAVSTMAVRGAAWKDGTSHRLSCPGPEAGLSQVRFKATDTCLFYKPF